MRQVTMICTLMFDVNDRESVDIAKTRIIDLVNKTLSEANLDAQPQIDWSAPSPVTSITPKGFDTLLTPVPDPIWRELRDDYEDDDFVHIDAWETEDGDEQGKVIAKINMHTAEVTYLDDRARVDANAQELINAFIIKAL